MASSPDLTFLLRRDVLKRIAAASVACACLGAAYGTFAPKYFASVLTIMPIKQQRGGISSLLGAEAAALAAGLDSSLGAADVAQIAAVLQSNAVADAAIEKFDLKTRYGKKHREFARSALWAHCHVRALPKPGLVQVACEDRDPQFARDLLAFLADHGNQVFRRAGISSASEERRFLETHVADLRKQADAAAARMLEFQEKHQIVDIDTQAKAVVSAIAALNTQRITKQLELEYSRTFSSRDEPGLRQLESQLSIVDDKLRELEVDAPVVASAGNGRRARGGGAGNGMFPAALTVPKLRAEFESLYRDRRVSEATLVFALERLEGARASEAREASTFVVLDPPTLPTRHSRPKRMFATGAAMLFGLLAAFGFEWFRSAGGVAALVAATRRRST
jgi:tyrosine-protein kinase Etk/Wzc